MFNGFERFQEEFDKINSNALPFFLEGLSFQFPVWKKQKNIPRLDRKTVTQIDNSSFSQQYCLIGLKILALIKSRKLCREIQSKLTSKSAKEISLSPSPLAFSLCSCVTCEPIFTRFFSLLHECACSRSSETLSSLQTIVESSAEMKQNGQNLNMHAKT